MNSYAFVVAFLFGCGANGSAAGNGEGVKIVKFSSDVTYMSEEKLASMGMKADANGFSFGARTYATIKDVPSEGIIWYKCMCVNDLHEEYISKQENKDGYFLIPEDFYSEESSDDNTLVYLNKELKKADIKFNCTDKRSSGIFTKAVCIVAY